MTGQELLDKVRETYKEKCRILFRFPYVYIYIFAFERDQKEEDQKNEVINELDVKEEEFDEICENCFLRFEFLSEEESKDDLFPQNSRGASFLGAFCGSKHLEQITDTNSPPQVVHFYGYKGGQARSTVLACVARQIAENGYRVLVVDADIEAPSLNNIFGVDPKTTLIELVRKSVNIEPVAYTRFVLNSDSPGQLDLIACRSKELNDNLEYTAFSLWANISPVMLEDVAKKIQTYAKQEHYDVILFDHRSGFAVPTLTWMQTLPGPCVLCIKLDEQWRSAKSGLESIFECNISNPGCIVYFKPDHESAESYEERERVWKQKEEIAEIFAMANAKGAEKTSSEDEMENSNPEMAMDRLIRWDYDSVFREHLLPPIDKCAQSIRNTIKDVISFLDLPEKDSKTTKTSSDHTTLISKSGAKDEGMLIQTEMFRQLIAPNNNLDYIFGRKGAGKTRMLKELAKKGIGAPLLVDPYDNTTRGIQTTSNLFESYRKWFDPQKDKKNFWWGLLLAGLQTDRCDREELEQKLKYLRENHPIDDFYSEVLQLTSSQPKRTFLIDSVELAFTSEIGKYVEGLFAFARQLQTDARLKDKIQVKLFLRQDLLNTTDIQNLEQQIEGREIELRWNYQRILNFFLSRIPSSSYPFFQAHFKETVDKIEQLEDNLKMGNVTQEECESLLEIIFPKKLRRFNIGLSTYFRLHFSDSFSNKSDNSYYPRVFLNFLDAIQQQADTRTVSLTDKQVDQGMIIRAQEMAAERFLKEAEQELTNILTFESEKTANDVKIAEWLKCFEGEPTPFTVDNMVKSIEKKLGEGRLQKETIRQNLNRMQGFGMFETLVEKVNKWRVSRLYKSALKMKFNRT